MKNKLLTIFFCVILALSMIACGKKEETFNNGMKTVGSNDEVTKDSKLTIENFYDVVELNEVKIIVDTTDEENYKFSFEDGTEVVKCDDEADLFMSEYEDLNGTKYTTYNIDVIDETKTELIVLESSFFNKMAEYESENFEALDDEYYRRLEEKDPDNELLLFKKAYDKYENVEVVITEEMDKEMYPIGDFELKLKDIADSPVMVNGMVGEELHIIGLTENGWYAVDYYGEVFYIETDKVSEGAH